MSRPTYGLRGARTPLIADSDADGRGSVLKAVLVLLDPAEQEAVASDSSDEKQDEYSQSLPVRSKRLELGFPGVPFDRRA